MLLASRCSQPALSRVFCASISELACHGRCSSCTHEKHRGVLAAHQRPDVKEKIAQNQLDQLLQKLGLIRLLTAEQATTLSAAFEGSCFTDTHRNTWVEAVSSKIAHDGRSSGRKPTQSLFHFGAFLTPTEVQLLAGGGNMCVKLEAMATRCLLVGLTNPPEQTVGHVIATGKHHGIVCTQGESFDLVQEFKRLLKKTRGDRHPLSPCTCSATPATRGSCPRRFSISPTARSNRCSKIKHNFLHRVGKSFSGEAAGWLETLCRRGMHLPMFWQTRILQLQRPCSG